MTEINSIKAYHHRLDMNQYYVNKQKIVDYHNKLRQISKDALDNYNERVDRAKEAQLQIYNRCLLYTSPSPRDGRISRMPSSA